MLAPLIFVPLSGIIDGVGTELGGMALLIIVAKIIYEIVKERKSKAAATKLAERNGNPGNPGPLVRRPGQSTNDLILSILNEHTQQIKCIDINPETCKTHDAELRKIKEDVVNIRIAIARIEENMPKN